MDEENNTAGKMNALGYYCNAGISCSIYGITSGTTATTFSPDADCTRAQIVTFLYRSIK